MNLKTPLPLFARTAEKVSKFAQKATSMLAGKYARQGDTPMSPVTQHFFEEKIDEKDASPDESVTMLEALSKDISPLTSRCRTCATNSRNNSGMVGIRLEFVRGCYYWTAYWSTEKGQCTRRFSVKALGYFPAWEMAVSCREKNTGVPLPDMVLTRSRVICMERWPEVAPYANRPS